MKDYNFIFAYVPKVACSNWKCIFRYMNNQDDYLNTAIAHNRELSGLEFLSDFDNYKHIISDNKIKKYCFIRDPFSRILSAYLNKIEPYRTAKEKHERQNNFFHKISEEINDWRKANLPEEKDLNLYCFLKWIESSKSYHINNEHWMTQTSLLNPDTIKYDYIGRFENIKKDADAILNFIGCDLPFPSQRKIEFPSTNATKKLSAYFGDRETLLTKEIYKKDFELFNYSSILQDSIEKINLN